LISLLRDQIGERVAVLRGYDVGAGVRDTRLGHGGRARNAVRADDAAFDLGPAELHHAIIVREIGELVEAHRRTGRQVGGHRNLQRQIHGDILRIEPEGTAEDPAV
jgi:hypothetical protein